MSEFLWWARTGHMGDTEPSRDALKNFLTDGTKNTFASLAESGGFEMAGLRRQFGISRKAGYKWLARYREYRSLIVN